jgi:uncharacterized membrane protein
MLNLAGMLAAGMNRSNKTSLIILATLSACRNSCNRYIWEGRGLIQLGLLLILVPVVRVAIAAFAFHRQRDRLYVAISLLVLGLLLYSLLSGLFHS